MPLYQPNGRALSLVFNKRWGAICHKSRLASFLSPTSGIDFPSRRLARNLTCRTQSSHLPFTELPEPRSSTKVRPEVWNTMVQLCLWNTPFAGTQPCPRCSYSRSDPPPLLKPLTVCMLPVAPCSKGMFADRTISLTSLFQSSVILPPAFVLTWSRRSPAEVRIPLPNTSDS